MTSQKDHQRAVVDRKVTLRARGDIQQVRGSFSGQAAYVLKDPLTLEMLHLTPEEFFLFESLRSQTTINQICRAMERRFAPRRFTVETVQHGLNQLHDRGLLVSEAPGQGEQLLERARRRKRSERLQSAMSLLSFRVGSFDATRLVDGLYGQLSWVYSKPAMVLALGVVCYAAMILVGGAAEIEARLPDLAELAQPKLWILWALTIAGVKAVHELSHALTCKHVGGRCHEIGMLLLAMLPCLYCDVTDVWRLPNKWHRIAVSAAGMAVELLMAATATILWWHTQPGLLNTWCLSIVVVCSVGTLLVNLNPLLRYDGYYILSDLVEIPNLSGQARGLLPGSLRRWLLGEPRQADPLLSDRQRRGLAFYAVAAKIYLTLVLVGIFAMLLAWTRPHHLENIVYTLACFTLLGMLYRPLTALGSLLRNPMTRSRLRSGRAIPLAAAVLLAAFAVVFYPIPRTVTAPLVLVPADSRTVYATAAGELLETVAPGTRVRAGDVVARLADPQVHLAFVRQQGERDVQQVKYDQLLMLRALDNTSAQKLPTAQAALDDARAQLEERQREAERLVARSPIDGTVLAPPEIMRTAEDTTRLSRWSGSLLDDRNHGCWVESGAVLCVVAGSDELEALVAVDQWEVPQLQPDQKVRIQLDASPTKILTGRVIQIARRAEEPSAAAPGSAQFATPFDTTQFHLVQVRLDQPAALLSPVGSRGTAKIETNVTTLGEILATHLKRVLRMPW